MFYFLLFLAAYLPFQIALSPAAGIDLASIRVVIILLFLAWLAKGLKDKKLRILPDWQTACILAFLFLSGFSIFFAQNVFWGERKLLFLLSIFPIYFIAADILNTREKIKKLSRVLVVSGALAAAIGILQSAVQFLVGVGNLYHFWARYATVPFLGRTFSQAVLDYPSWLVNISGHTYFRAISVFPDPHMLALFLGLLFPMSVALFFTEKKTVWLVCAGVILLADVLTFSRGAYLGLVSGALIWIILFWSKFSSRYKVGFLAGLLFLAAIILVPSPASSRFFSSFNLQEGSNIGRLAMWRAAEEKILARPMTGVGLGNFPLAIDPLAAYREPIYAHNTYLDIAVEAGIFSALAWIGLLLVSLRAFLEKAEKDKFFLGAFFGLLIFSVHSIVETGIYSPVVLTLFLLAISFSGKSEKNEEIA